MEEQTKKGVPGFVPLIALGVAIVAIVLYAFLPALSIDGRDYVGWMVTFYYWGHQYIYHYHEFGFNLVLSLATVLPAILTIVTLAMWKHASAGKRMVLSWTVQRCSLPASPTSTSCLLPRARSARTLN